MTLLFIAYALGVLFTLWGLRKCILGYDLSTDCTRTEYYLILAFYALAWPIPAALVWKDHLEEIHKTEQ